MTLFCVVGSVTIGIVLAILISRLIRKYNIIINIDINETNEGGH